MEDRARDSSEHPHWRRNAHALAAGNVLVNVGWAAAFAFLPLIVKALGVERDLELWIGVTMFGYYGLSCLFTPVWGVLADHYGRKSMVLRAGFGMATGFTVLAFTSDPLLFAAVLILTGLANGFVPAGHALVATTTPRRDVGGALALTQAGAQLGTLVGPMVGAALIGVLATPSSLFLVTGVAMYAGAFLVLWRVRERHVRPAERLRIDLRADIARLWRVPELKLLYAIQVLYAFMVYGAVPVVTLFTLELMAGAGRHAGLAVESWIAVTAIGFTFAAIVALPAWGWLLDRHPGDRMLLLILAGTLITGVLQPLARDPLELTIARVLFALFVSGLAPALIRMIRDRAPQGMEARTLAYGTAIQQLGSATAPLVAAAVSPWLGLRGYFALSAVMIAMGWLAWRRVVRRAA